MMRVRQTEGSGARAALAAALAVALSGGGCGAPGPGAGGNAATAARPAPPAKVEGAPKEADLATVTLTPEAEAHLGLAVAPAEKRPVPRTTTYAGEVIVPPGRTLAVTAPFVGTIKAPAGSDRLPRPGDVLKPGQPVCQLVPILSPESRATLAPLLMEAEGTVKQATEQLHIAKVALDRAENLVRDKLGGSATLVDAKAQYDLAAATLKAAEARRATIEKVAGDAESGALSVQAIAAPGGGTVQNVHVSPGQQVAAGAALFELAALDPVWVKVAVYVGEVPRVAADRPAEVGGLAGDDGQTKPRPAAPVSAPPTGDPLAATVHLYYEAANPGGAFRPGERVGVTLPLKGDQDGLTVPRASLVRDIHGGAWVYEKVADHKYARRRVLVDRVAGDRAVLVYGPKPGVNVVTDGAAELYGAEFGGGK